MKSILIASAAAALAFGAAPAAMAAHAGSPYANVDRSNDAGNDTGDSKIDALNAAQLDQNYKGQYYNFTPGAAPPPSAAPSGAMVTQEGNVPPPPRPMRRPVRRPAPPPQ